MHYFIIQTTKMMILWMRQKYVKNGIIKSKTLHLYIHRLKSLHRAQLQPLVQLPSVLNSSTFCL